MFTWKVTGTARAVAAEQARMPAMARNGLFFAHNAYFGFEFIADT
jgi:hypothetical protein